MEFNKLRAHIYLDHLTSLRNLKIISLSHGFETRWDIRQPHVCRLLSSATSPTGIQCMDLHFNVQILPWQWATLPIPTWTEFDSILSGRAFVDLRRLDLRFHFVHTSYQVGFARSGNECYRCDADILASNPSVELHLETRTIFTALSTSEYLNSSYSPAYNNVLFT
jgi:hypothetical protein